MTYVSYHDYRVKAEEMGLVSGIALMGAPVIHIEKLVNGEETLSAFSRLQRVLASGVCEGVEDGKVGNEGVEVVQKTCSYVDGTQFSYWLASDTDLKKIDVSDSNNIPLVCCCIVSHNISFIV